MDERIRRKKTIVPCFIICFWKPWGFIMCDMRCKMLTQASHASLQSPSVCLLNHRCIALSWHLPPGWGSLRRALRWLGARARTTRRICPAGCGGSWPTTRWRSRSSEPVSTRCRSTSSHPPAGGTAPYLGQVTKRHRREDAWPKPGANCVEIFPNQPWIFKITYFYPY